MEGILSPTHSFFNTEKGGPERLSKLLTVLQSLCGGTEP